MSELMPRGGGLGGTERFPLALHRGFPAVQREKVLAP